MTIGTPDFALGNFCCDLGPRTALCHHAADISEFHSTHVIKVKYHHVVFVALNTRVNIKIFTYTALILADDLPLAGVHNTLVLDLVSVIVSRSAKAAIGLSSILAPRPSIEVFNRLLSLALTAQLHHLEILSQAAFKSTPGEDRTPGTRGRNSVLYPLSYRGVPLLGIGPRPTRYKLVARTTELQG